VVMFLPMLPHLQEYFAVSVTQISWLPNIGYLTMIVFSIIVGKLINKVGIKNLILISLSLWILGIVIELIALGSISFYTFVMGRFIEGVGEAFIFPILLSMNKAELKVAKEEKIGLSLIEFSAALGGLIAAMISGKLLNNPGKFLVIPISIAVITMVFIIFKFNKTRLFEEQKEVVNEKAKESMKAYISLLIMIFMVQAIFVSIQVYLAYYLEVFNASSLTGVIISIEEVMIGLGTLAPIFIFKNMSFKRIRNIIVVALGLGSVILALQISIYIAIATSAVIAFFVGAGFTALNFYVLKTIKTKVTQKLSLYSTIRISGGFVLSIVWGNLIESYKSSGLSYREIFKYLYLFEGIYIVLIFIIIVYMQKREVSFE